MSNFKLNIYIYIYIYIYKVFPGIYKKGKTVIKFGDIEIKRQKFHQHKRLISIKKYRY